MSGFFLGLVVVVLLAHYYLWRRLVRDTTAPGGPARRVGTAAAVLLPLLAIGAPVSGRIGVPWTVHRMIAWPGFVWVAVMLYLVLALLAGELVRPLLLRYLARRDIRTRERDAVEEPGPVSHEDGSGLLTVTVSPAARTEDPAPSPSRRLFVARTVALTATAVAAGTVANGMYGVLRGPEVRRVTVPLARLPRSGDGFRIAVVSDIHLGPILGRAHTERIVERINATRPDLVAVVGDLVDGSVAELGSAAEPLARLDSRYGTYFVTGNHEYYSGAEQWLAQLREFGLRPLENARAELAAFDLAGVNDPAGEEQGQGPDFVRALGDRDPSRAVVLLAHQPVVIHDAVRYGVDLQLSGHTHGGQLWPGNHLAALANPTVAGLERYGDTQLYVSRGAGAWGPPVRVGAPADITLVELTSRQS
ncbi:metallophosphoesterase [Streptomyces sp. NPDC014986]|uniref:metallophosphoesterase n=1 Tax=Streptomyces sp. NPDC014986 TaxID=3364934 RepID=UPI0036F7B869